jgi:hypothetical protein
MDPEKNKIYEEQIKRPSLNIISSLQIFWGRYLSQALDDASKSLQDERINAIEEKLKEEKRDSLFETIFIGLVFDELAGLAIEILGESLVATDEALTEVAGEAAYTPKLPNGHELPTAYFEARDISSVKSASSKFINNSEKAIQKAVKEKKVQKILVTSPLKNSVKYFGDKVKEETKEEKDSDLKENKEAVENKVSQLYVGNFIVGLQNGINIFYKEYQYLYNYWNSNSNEFEDLNNDQLIKWGKILNEISGNLEKLSMDDIKSNFTKIVEIVLWAMYTEGTLFGYSPLPGFNLSEIGYNDLLIKEELLPKSQAIKTPEKKYLAEAYGTLFDHPLIGCKRNPLDLHRVKYLLGRFPHVGKKDDVHSGSKLIKLLCDKLAEKGYKDREKFAPTYPNFNSFSDIKDEQIAYWMLDYYIRFVTDLIVNKRIMNFVTPNQTNVPNAQKKEFSDVGSEQKTSVTTGPFSDQFYKGPYMG